jgi:MSHA biogenesis protein MshJ
MSRWQQWSATFMAFTLRERAITTLTLILGGAFLLLNFVVDPWKAKALAANSALMAAQAEIPKQQALIASLQATPADPDAANRKKLAQVKDQLAAINDWLKQFEATLVAPMEMPELLEGVLARHPRLELVSMKTQAPSNLSAVGDPPGGKGAKTGGPPTDGIYQHTIELNLAGSYNDLLSYILALERLPQHLMWTSANVKVDKYPRTVMVLRIYTLSFDPNWLQI